MRKSGNRNQPVADKNFELQDMTSTRTLRDFLFWKLLPVGNLAEGPGIVWLLSAQFRHKFGRRIATMQLSGSSLYRRLASLRGRLLRLLGRD